MTEQNIPGAAQEPPPQIDPERQDTTRHQQEPSCRLPYTRYATAGKSDDRIVDITLYRFFWVMVVVGGVGAFYMYGDVIGSWMYARGQQSVAVSSRATLTQAPATSVSPTASDQGMTTATVKAALTETKLILDSADQIADKLRPQSQAVATPQVIERVIERTVPLSQSTETALPQAATEPRQEATPPPKFAPPPPPRRLSAFDPPTSSPPSP